VAEIIQAILIASSFRWWTSVAAFLVVATAALVHTIYRSDEDMFPGMSSVYKKFAACSLNCAGAASSSRR
jgi:hypothetical protein